MTVRATVMTVRATVMTYGATVRTNAPSVRTNESSVRTNESSVRTNESSVRTNESSVRTSGATGAVYGGFALKSKAVPQSAFMDVHGRWGTGLTIHFVLEEYFMVAGTGWLPGSRDAGGAVAVV
jgi:hypothetical protein